MSSAGRSWVLVSTIPMRDRTPMPWWTLPKMVCFPSNQLVCPSVRKNWLPFVFGPALAIAKIPAPLQDKQTERQKGNDYLQFKR